MSLSPTVRGLLDRPGLLGHVAAVSPSGLPLLGSLWFVLDQSRFWFNSKADTPLLNAAANGQLIAVIIDEFEPPDRITQVRVRGRGRLESHDPERVASIYRRYLGEELSEWPVSFPERLSDPAWVLWSVPTTTGMVVDYSGFLGDETRWGPNERSPL